LPKDSFKNILEHNHPAFYQVCTRLQAKAQSLLAREQSVSLLILLLSAGCGVFALRVLAGANNIVSSSSGSVGRQLTSKCQLFMEDFNSHNHHP